MSELLQKVARAIQATDPANIGYKTGFALARVALEAMREPGIDLLQVGYPAMIDANKKQIYGEAIIDAAWRAMIYAALASDPRS